MTARHPFPDYVGGLNEDVLRQLHGHFRVVQHAHWNGSPGFDEAEKSAASRKCVAFRCASRVKPRGLPDFGGAAWRAIMLTYPELLAAARAGLERR